MKNKRNQIITTFLKNLLTLSNKFEKWDQILFDCLKEQFEEGVDKELYTKTQIMLGDILELIITSYKPKDKWDSFTTRPSPFDNNVITISQNIGVEITFGVSFSELSRGKTFYLESSDS